MNDSHLDQESSDLLPSNPPVMQVSEKENYLFSRTILIVLLLFSYPIMNPLEEILDIAERSNSLLLSNFIYLSTVVTTPLIYIFYKRFAKINDMNLLHKWEKDHPDYERIYWMNPLDLHKKLSLMGRLLHLLFNSILLSSIIILTSLSISLTLVYFAFDSNLSLILILALLFLVLPIIIGQLFLLYDELYAATGLYLYDGSLVIRSALLFRSLPHSTYKIDKLEAIVVKETNSFSYDVPIYHLKTSKSKWSSKTLSYSDNYETMIDLENTIRKYIMEYSFIREYTE